MSQDGRRATGEVVLLVLLPNASRDIVALLPNFGQLPSPKSSAVQLQIATSPKHLPALPQPSFEIHPAPHRRYLTLSHQKLKGTNSLPARPPVTAPRAGFKPAFGAVSQPAPPPPPSYANANAGPHTRPHAPGYHGAPAASQYGPSYPTYPNRAPHGVNSAAPAYSYPQQPSYGPQSYGQPAAYAAPPQIKNPFPTPGAAGSDYDPDMAAQIAQWQSAYIPKEADKDGKPTPATDLPKVEVPDTTAQPDRKKTIAREGGGKKWTDDTLLDWDPSHLRLFVGNLAGETTDESLLKAFCRWKSVQKARVIRDKRTTKSKGYGFVSFSNADDFFQAAKEMHGKYIQSHPVVVKKANTELKVTNVKERDRGRRNNNNSYNQRQGGNQSGGGHEPHLGPMPGAGVTKPGQKTKNGLRLLG